MPISERDYMRRNDRPPVNRHLPFSGMSNFKVGLIALIGVGIGFALYPKFNNNHQPTTQRRSSGRNVKISRKQQLSELLPLDLNTATHDHLCLLPKVNSEMASNIINRRPFTEIDQLDDVRRIGPKTLEILRPLVTINETSPSKTAPPDDG